MTLDACPQNNLISLLSKADVDRNGYLNANSANENSRHAGWFLRFNGDCIGSKLMNLYFIPRDN